MSGDNNKTGVWGSGEQDHTWGIPGFERRRVERMVRQVLRVNSIEIDGIVDIVGSFVGGRLRGRQTTSWFLSLSGRRRNRNLPDSDE